MDSDYPFDIFKLFLSLCPLTVVLPVLLFFDLWILTTLMTSSNSSYPFVPWQLYCLSFFSLIYGFWLPLWHLQTLLIHLSPDSCIVCPSFLWFMDSDYPFGIFKPFLTRTYLKRDLYLMDYHIGYRPICPKPIHPNFGWLIDWLVFNVQRAIFQLYSGREHLTI